MGEWSVDAKESIKHLIKMKKKIIIWAVVIMGLLFLGISALTNRASSFDTISAVEGDIKIYKTGSCGCCGIYVNYFKNKGNPKIEVVNLNSLQSIKEEYGIPSDLESCHTVVIGDYFVEGHIPLEAIEKLLKERPDIKGIAMPGMPTGSPGMPGTKKEAFTIYAVNNDGSYQEWMKL